MTRLKIAFLMATTIYSLHGHAVNCLYRQATHCHKMGGSHAVDLIDTDVDCYTGAALSAPRVQQFRACMAGQLDPRPRLFQYIATYTCRELNRTDGPLAGNNNTVVYTYIAADDVVRVRDNCGP